MPSLLLVMLGGGVGAGGRYLVGRLALSLLGSNYPWGTLAANILGGLAMGLLAGILARFGEAGEQYRLLIGVGMLGGFTTFSSFSLEVVLMIERGAWPTALGYVLVSAVGAIVALMLGLSIVRGVA